MEGGPYFDVAGTFRDWSPGKVAVWVVAPASFLSSRARLVVGAFALCMVVREIRNKIVFVSELVPGLGIWDIVGVALMCVGCAYTLSFVVQRGVFVPPLSLRFTMSSNSSRSVSHQI